MPFQTKTSLWMENERKYFSSLSLHPIHQMGPHCVSTCLAMLTGTGPESFEGEINTQNPVTWSDALMPFGMKLAYCPSDIRKLKFYLNELVELDDLFLLCYYTDHESLDFLDDPDQNGWIGHSHVVILYQNLILDPQTGKKDIALHHFCNECFTKRIFRVVPKDHKRGL